MRVIFLGTGDAGGVPLYGCNCPACLRARADAAFIRRSCSALVQAGATRILIDAGLGDLAERFPPGSLSAIVLTHFHPDHVQGLLHLRWGVGNTIPVYGPPDPEGCADLYRNHGILEFRHLAEFETINFGDLMFTPLPLIHSKVTFGYAIQGAAGRRFAYLTDTIGLPPQTERFLQDWRPVSMAVDCTHPPQDEAPSNHNDLTRSLAIAQRSASENVLLTHISHEMDAWMLKSAAGLPSGVTVVQDGQVVVVPDVKLFKT